MNYTPGEWTVKDIPSHGLEIFAEVNMGKDENGGVLQPIYNVDIEPYLRVDKNGKAYVMIAYESWRQFPSVNFQEMQKANAQLIASAPDSHEELKRGREWLARFVMKFYAIAENPTYENMKPLYQELDAFQRTFGEKALAKAEEK